MEYSNPRHSKMSKQFKMSEQSKMSELSKMSGQFALMMLRTMTIWIRSVGTSML